VLGDGSGDPRAGVGWVIGAPAGCRRRQVAVPCPVLPVADRAPGQLLDAGGACDCCR
jgi:hypothetical protein